MKHARIWILPLILLVLVEWLKTQPAKVEDWYAAGIYPFIGLFFRRLLGWIPFSIGDISIAILSVWGLYLGVLFIKKIRREKSKKSLLLKGLKQRIALFGLWAYLLFHLLWALNYYRLGSAHLLALSPESYTTADTDSLVAILTAKIKLLTLDSNQIDKTKTTDRNTLSSSAQSAYAAASTRYPFMKFRSASLKPNLLGPLQSYTGYAGYLFPFTGEAHANFYGPDFTLPFTVCHEMAHQLGFGTESEANLIGFLAARESDQKAFEYSAYAGVHQYALSELFVRDSIRGKRCTIDSLPVYFKRG
jgi:hypothetical protein